MLKPIPDAEISICPIVVKFNIGHCVIVVWGDKTARLGRNIGAGFLFSGVSIIFQLGFALHRYFRCVQIFDRWIAWASLV
jgi:hypothetical protein